MPFLHAARCLQLRQRRVACAVHHQTTSLHGQHKRAHVQRRLVVVVAAATFAAVAAGVVTAECVEVPDAEQTAPRPRQCHVESSKLQITRTTPQFTEKRRASDTTAKPFHPVPPSLATHISKQESIREWLAHTHSPPQGTRRVPHHSSERKTRLRCRILTPESCARITTATGGCGLADENRSQQCIHVIRLCRDNSHH